MTETKKIYCERAKCEYYGEVRELLEEQAKQYEKQIQELKDRIWKEKMATEKYAREDEREMIIRLILKHNPVWSITERDKLISKIKGD